MISIFLITRRRIMVAVLLSLLGGCKDERVDKQAKQISDLKDSVQWAGDRIRDLSNKAAMNAAKIEDLQKLVRGQASQIDMLNFHEELNPFPTWANLTTDGHGYSMCLTDHGTFAVKLAGVAPYLDGFKIHLQVGNLTAATITSGSIRMFYNTAAPEGPDASHDDDDGKWHQFKLDRKAWQLKEKLLNDDPTLPEIPVGSWRSVEVTILKVKPEDIASMRVLVVPDGISLHGDRVP